MKNIPLFSRRSSPRAQETGPYPAETPSSTTRRARNGRRRVRWIVLSMAGIAGAATAALLGLALFLPARISLDGGIPAQLSPDTPIVFSLPHLGAALADLEVTEATRDINGTLGPEKPVAVRLARASGSGRLEPWSELQLERQDGSNLLNYDRVYRLRVSLRTETLAFPFPKELLVTRDYQIDTLVTPQLRVPTGVVEMAYQKPLELQWNSPVQAFSVETQPAVQVRTRVDASRPDLAYVELQDAKPGAQYQLRVTRAVGANGAPMMAPASVTVETPASPNPIGDSVKLEDGDRVGIRWDRAIRELQYEITPAVKSSVQVDPGDPRLTSILLQDPAQQQEYRIKVTGGTATTGAPIAAGAEFSIVTPPALEVTRLLPRGDSYGISLDSTISITFGHPIKDRSAAEAAISIQPALEGSFEWPSDNQVRFVPSGPLPDNTEIAVRIVGGAKGVRGTDGSYLQEDYDYSFLTRPDKLIDVDLTHQTITLYEADRVVYTGLVAAGVPGAPTPTGSFMVDYKMPSTRMKGVNPDGSRYDIANVPWVMSFQGDYTLHGAPWRTRFGYPGSAGCVSMEPSQAKMLYDWSPVGTPVKIHY